MQLKSENEYHCVSDYLFDQYDDNYYQIIHQYGFTDEVFEKTNGPTRKIYGTKVFEGGDGVTIFEAKTKYYIVMESSLRGVSSNYYMKKSEVPSDFIQKVRELDDKFNKLKKFSKEFNTVVNKCCSKFENCDVLLRYPTDHPRYPLVMIQFNKVTIDFQFNLGMDMNEIEAILMINLNLVKDKKYDKVDKNYVSLQM